MTTPRSQFQAQSQAMSTPQDAEATQESHSPKGTSSQESIGSTPSQGNPDSTKSQECPLSPVTEFGHMAHFWMSYGRCTMPGSPMVQSEGLPRRWTG